MRAKSHANGEQIFDCLGCKPKTTEITCSFFQVLITDSSVEVSNKLNSLLPALRRLATAKLTNDQAEELGQILDQLIM